MVDLIPNILQKIAKDDSEVCLYFEDKYRNYILTGEIKLQSIKDRTGGIEVLDNMKELEVLSSKVKNLKSKISAIINEETEREEASHYEEINIKSFERNFDQRPFYAWDPRELTFLKDITDRANNQRRIDDLFCVFQAKTGEHLIVWGTPEYQLCIYDCQKEEIINEFKAHEMLILTTRHFYDHLKDKDIIITSSYDRSVKLWDVNENFQNILTIPDTHTTQNVYSVMVVNVKLNNYIVTSCYESSDNTKVWDYETGGFIRKVGNDLTYFISFYYDRRKRKHYIINGNEYDVRSYDFITGELYKKYISGISWHLSACIREDDESTQLIDSVCSGAHIYIFDFHSAVLLKKLDAFSGPEMRGLCLWGFEFLFVAGDDGHLKLLDLVGDKRISQLEGHSGVASCIKKFEHPIYGESLVSFSNEGKIKLWVNKNKII
jgi:WD40 repeat protein